ncbi:MAG: hypothetical protein FJZ01_21715 [Candidatus Sericytochromatia bacterium]|nr:hypothetical protein [Candidatus Tanganyikabacteria bacterium]
MAEQIQQAESPEAGAERVPVMQELLDNIWFLFLVSGIFTLVFYIIWGLIDLTGRPILP